MLESVKAVDPFVGQESFRHTAVVCFEELVVAEAESQEPVVQGDVHEYKGIVLFDDKLNGHQCWLDDIEIVFARVEVHYWQFHQNSDRPLADLIASLRDVF